MGGGWQGELRQAVEALSTGTQWRDHRARFDGWIENDPHRAVQICAALAEFGTPENQGARMTMRHRVIQQLTLHADGLPALTAVVREVDLTPDSSDQIVRELGHLPAERIDEVLAGLNPEARREAEFGFALSQERLLRHHSLGAPGRSLDAAARRWGGSALWLPPTLHPMEADLRTRLPFGGPNRTPQVEPTFRPLSVAATSSTLARVLDERGLTIGVSPPDLQCRTAHERMVLESNGKIGMALFDQGRPGRNEAWEDELGSDVTATEIPVWELLNYFFATAFCPGAYARRLTGWRARLGMGRALAGWVDADPMASFSDVIDHATDQQWFRIETWSSEWFYDVAWDSAVLGVGDDRAVLLWATDTD